MSDEEQPIDDDHMDDFYRILDEVFGAFDRGDGPRPDTDDESWVSRANRWFIGEFRKFSEDVDEILGKIPEIMGDDPETVFGTGSDMVMDAWIDGRHYEITISRIDDEFALPEPEVRVSAVDNQPGFDDDFVEEWA